MPATLITSNLPFDEWTETFGSERLTGALLDRLTHHVSILEMNGDSYLFLRNRTLSPRLAYVMEAAPGCVLITVIAPHFVANNLADLIALAITILAASRLSILPTVIVAIGAAGLLRAVLGG